MIPRKFLILTAALLLTSLAAPARKLPSEALGTVSYEVRYKWGALDAKAATATISLDAEERDGQDAYHSRALIRPTSVFKLFISHDYIADTWLNRSDLKPAYFINPFKKGGKDGKFEITYRRSGIDAVSVKPPKETEEKKSFPQDGRTMDLLSLLHCIRFLDMTPATRPMKFHILMGGASFPAVLSCQGEDKERFPDRRAERFLLRMTERGLMENGSGNEILLWRSTGADRRLLGLEVPLSTGSMIVKVKE